MASANKDHWSSNTYQASASFVPKLATKVVQYLDAKPSDKILDIGCGDGVLTLDLASSCSSIVGLDFSASMIQTAKDEAAKKNITNATFGIADCSRLPEDGKSFVQPGSYDKVFSNAAMHWILRNPETRDGVFRGAYDALKPGGVFVFECGGAGNVAETVTAFIASLVHVAGLSVDAARELIPWYFASEAWASARLEKAGFKVEKIELEYRPTKLVEGQGIEGWLRLFGAGILDSIDESKRDGVINHAVGLLSGTVTREDGSEYIGYVRLRGIARKPQ
ncbi:methyltransferase domain-containing protein [Microthyrium microscopicum]|uniref:Methyltransferase domain-containing protein n=1 Tax=Microthyrium microscopicum TaxID=703497 RepID=A0A6A6UR57_9PEZI|nr:methyltransferase domain-containing protein [Microthyrium microscopicum]